MNKLHFILFTFLMSGCTTSYQPRSFSGGYSDSKLGDNIFRVSFEGNGYTRPIKTMDLALLRSAEITLQNGFEYFVIISNGTQNSYSSFTTPQSTTTNGTINTYGNISIVNIDSVNSSGQTHLISKPSTTNTIACFKEKPKGSSLVYDASFIVQSIKNKYKIR